MNQIDDLIRELAPRVIQHRPLGTLCTVVNGCAFKSEFFNNAGVGLPLIRIRDINTGYSNTFFSGDYERRYVVETGDLLIGMDGDFRAVLWRHGRALLNQRVCRLQEFDPEILPAFMYYYVQGELNRIHEATQQSTVKHLSSRELEKALIPVLPLGVQREIVRILDNFTELEMELEAKLEAELESRRHQFAYYREQLFAFHDEDTVRWSKMSEAGEFSRGRRFTKDDMVADGISSIHYGEIYTHFGTYATKTVSRVRNELRSSLRFAKPGDLVIASVGETVEDVGKAVAWLGDEDVAIHDDCFSYRHSMNPKYVSYYFQTARFHSEKNKYVARAKVKRLSGASLGKLTIPVPSDAEQARIVAILDDFDALVNDLSIGLPAELAGRRKQYEYYRDRLLTFEEAAA